GQWTERFSAEATTRLATASTATETSTRIAATNAVAVSLPPSTAFRPARWDSTVFRVRQPYSLPVISAPSTRTTAPPRSGHAPNAEGISLSGRTCWISWSGEPNAPPVPPLRTRAYGRTYEMRLSSTNTTPITQTAGRLRSLSNSADRLPCMRDLLVVPGQFE